MNRDPECPGRGKCHGPQNWCPECGDVDLVCDDPQCDVHLRGEERLARLRAAKIALDRTEADYNVAQRNHAEAEKAFQRWEFGNSFMVSRIYREKKLSG